MEPRIRERFNDGILHAAMQCYGIADEQITRLDGFESFMFAFARGGGDYILRIGHSLRRSENLIQGEVDWINYLADGGASVARAALSARGRLVEAIDDGQGGRFLATAFVRARGRSPWEVGWSDALYERYGRLIGRMHVLSKQYAPSNPAWQRPAWDDPLMLDTEKWLPESDTAAAEKLRAVKAHLATLPKDRAGYGLVHQDAHGGNFFVDDAGEITLFDFDDCVYCWYLYDIAMVLFYMVVLEDDPAALTRAFMAHFLRGYARENRLDPAWLAEMPWFLKLREIDLYAVIHRSYGADVDDWWPRRYMEGRRARIERDAPFVDFDFAELATFL